MALSLSPQQLEQYKNDGWCIVGKIMDDATLEAFRSEERRFRGENNKDLTIFRSQLCNYSEIIREYLMRGPQIPLAQQLVGTKNLSLWFNQFVTKMPDGNSGKSEFPWHQDNGYAAVLPATNVTIWVPLDDVDTNNGCVWVQPGSHKLGLLDHKQKSADNWHLEVPVQGDGIPAVLKAGEAVAFTGLTLHRSKLNYSNKPRRAFFMEYADAMSSYKRPSEPEPTPMVRSADAWLVSGQIPWQTGGSY